MNVPFGVKRAELDSFFIRPRKGLILIIAAKHWFW